jgi:hypothetical protein
MKFPHLVLVIVAILLIAAAFWGGVVVTTWVAWHNAPASAIYGFGSGMMRGFGVAPSGVYTLTVPFGYGRGYGMMSGWGGWRDVTTTGGALTIDKAVEIAKNYVAAYDSANLELTEVMEFDNHFYGEAKEKASGIRAFEFLIDKYSGATFPEYGPSMMWNTKYGHMGGGYGMMGGYRGAFTNPGAKNSVTPEQAKAAAQQYLASNLPGMTVADEVDAFYGYYTLHVLKDGKTYGMLSVNGFTGQVWYHTWHGTFVQLKESD